MKRLFSPASFCLLLTFCFVLLSPSAFAQGIPTGSDGLTLTASSDNPTPGQTVTIKVESYRFDTESATMIWAVNGKQTLKGIGAMTLDIKAPALGKKTNVSVTAVTTSNGSLTGSITIGSGSIDMIMETDGYVPPLFIGKMPLVYQNNVTVIAVPHLANTSGKEYDPATLIYQWKKDDGTVLQSQSGYGKQAITIAGDLVPRPYYLMVTATSRDGSAQGESLIQIAPQAPSMTFYSDDPLYGPLFNKAIGNTLPIGAQKEARAFAALFGFNLLSESSGNPTLNWTINGVSHPELSSSQSIVMRAPDGVSGTSIISLDARGVKDILQGVNGSFKVSFSASQTASSTPITF